LQEEKKVLTDDQCESFRLLDDSKLMLMAINVVSTVLFSIMAVYLGKIVALSIGTYLLRGN